MTNFFQRQVETYTYIKARSTLFFCRIGFSSKKISVANNRILSDVIGYCLSLRYTKMQITSRQKKSASALPALGDTRYCNGLCRYGYIYVWMAIRITRKN